MTTQVEFFFTIQGVSSLERTMNEWLRQADKKGYVIDDIQFQDSEGNQDYDPSITAMIRYRIEEEEEHAT